MSKNILIVGGSYFVGRIFVEHLLEKKGFNLYIVNRGLVSTYTLEIKEIEEQQIALPYPLEQHLIYSGALAAKTLGFNYMPFIEGMKRTWQWYCDENEKKATHR